MNDEELKMEKQMDNIQLEIKEILKQNEEYEKIFELQRKRTLEADKLWQKENNSPGTYPDLGKLIKWLMERYESLKCCGNCSKFVYINKEFKCTKMFIYPEYSSHFHCTHWQSDELTQEERDEE